MFGWKKKDTSNSNRLSLQEMPPGSIEFISIEECVGFIEQVDRQNKIVSYLILFNSKTHKFIKKKEGKYIIKVIIKKDGVVEAINDNSDEIIKRILLDKEVEVFGPPQSGEDYMNIQSQVISYLNKGYQRFGGRPLSISEKELIKNSFGEYLPKKVGSNITVKSLLQRLLQELAFSQEVLQEVVSVSNFERINAGTTPKNPNLLLFGPGGTGKSELLKSLTAIYEEKFNCYIAYQDFQTKQLLKGSTTDGDQKFAGAYEDTYKPILQKAIKEARIRGVPSIIPIDEGDIFVKNPNLEKGGHGQNVINFFKSYAGNYDELMFIISCNLSEQEFDGPATRDGRMNRVFIGPPQLKEMIKLFKDIFLKKMIDNNEIEIIPELEDSEIAWICDNLVKKNVVGSQIKVFFIKQVLQKKIDFFSISDDYTLDDLYRDNTTKKKISKNEFINLLQSYFGAFSNPRNTNESQTTENSNNSDPNLHNLYHMILETKKPNSRTSFKDFFGFEDKASLRRKVRGMVRVYFPDFYTEGSQEHTYATVILQFLNYCSEEFNKIDFNANNKIQFFNS